MKNAQGFNAAVLVAIIAALIIIYMLFLPEDEREKILEDEQDHGGLADNDLKILLKESIGKLNPAEKASDKEIPNVFLFETTSSKELARLNPLRVTNGVLDKKTATVSFQLENLENTENVFLTFTAQKRKGTLTISLNNNVIFEYELSKMNVDPIRLDKELLSSQNTLQFSVSGVGIKFWTTNEYALEQIKIIGDITDKSRQEGRNVFSLTEAEYQNTESALIRFVPYCTSAGNVGTLDVQINNQPVFSAVPVCDNVYNQDIPIGILNSGANKVIFKTSLGSYSVEQIKIKLTSKETLSSVFYFEINQTTYDQIIDNNKELKLTIDFVDEADRKRADINVNGHLDRIDQYKDYEKNVRNWIEEGNNFIKITPLTTMDIVELTVEMKE